MSPVTPVNESFVSASLIAFPSVLPAASIALNIARYASYPSAETAGISFGCPIDTS